MFFTQKVSCLLRELHVRSIKTGPTSLHINTSVVVLCYFCCLRDNHMLWLKNYLDELFAPTHYQCNQLYF
jgi:hypothetical protein